MGYAHQDTLKLPAAERRREFAKRTTRNFSRQAEQIAGSRIGIDTREFGIENDEGVFDAVQEGGEGVGTIYSSCSAGQVWKLLVNNDCT